MKLRHLIAVAALTLIPLTAGAATLIIPVAGTGPGANDSHWETNLIFHSTSARTIPLTLRFHDSEGLGKTFPLGISARTTAYAPDIVARHFDRTTATGGIEVLIDDEYLPFLSITSRIANVTDHGELGQDIPVVNAADAAKAGDLVVVPGPFDATAFRFNFGIYATADTKVRWELVRYDGSIAAAKDVEYDEGQQIQYNNGVVTLFESTPDVNDVVHATIVSGNAILYGSVIDQTSGDPTFVQSTRSREEIRINFLGVDRNSDGNVDIKDANRDGVLDAPVVSGTLGFPAFFRIVVTDASGAKPVFEILSSTADARLVDDNGTVQLVASAGLKGTTGQMTVRVTVDDQSSVVTIPLQFQ